MDDTVLPNEKSSDDSERRSLRRKDFYTGLVMLIFSLWEISQSLKMPMSESYAGVNNAWYVSPALFPLVIGGLLLCLSLALLTRGLSEGGGLGNMVRFKSGNALNSAISNKYLLVIGGLLTYVYAWIPNTDFILSSMLFLLVLISGFYQVDETDFGRWLRISVAIMVFSGILGLIVAPFLSLEARRLMMDSAGVLLAVVTLFYSVKLTRDKGKLKTGLMVALILPVVVGTVFKYLLLVPLPTEGVIVNYVMDPIFYTLFGSGGPGVMEGMSDDELNALMDAF